MISGKIYFFSVFVCILGKCSGKYSTLCVWSNVKQNNKKYPHPKPPESTKNRNHHCQPPKPTPQSTQTHLETHWNRNHPTTQPVIYRNENPNMQRPLRQSSMTMVMGQSWWRSLRFVPRGGWGGFSERSKKGWTEKKTELASMHEKGGFHEADRTERAEKEEVESDL